MVAFRKHVFPVFRRPRPSFVGEGLPLVFRSGFPDGFSLLSSLLRVNLCIFSACSRGRFFFCRRGRRSRGGRAPLFTAAMSPLFCSLLPSYSSFGMGTWSTPCRRTGAWRGMMRLAADTLTLGPCAGSKKTYLMSGYVLKL